MKYRIRNTETDKPLNMVGFHLYTDGLIYDDGFEVRPHLKAEMEVADGVYEGDYLLVYVGDIPSVYHIESHYRINVIGTNTKYSGNIEGFLVGVDFEVIKCR